MAIELAPHVMEKVSEIKELNLKIDALIEDIVVYFNEQMIEGIDDTYKYTDNVSEVICNFIINDPNTPGNLEYIQAYFEKMLADIRLEVIENRRSNINKQ